MALLYLDPYKDNKFGKIKGDKSTEFLRMDFEEVQFYTGDEENYIIAGQFTQFTGVTRAYKPEQPLIVDLVEVPIYGTFYELKQKKANTSNLDKSEYETIRVAPSLAELILYKHIQDNPSTYLDSKTAFRGSITLSPDIIFASKDNDAQQKMVLNEVRLTEIPKSGKYPDWKSYSSSNSYSKKSYNKKESLEDKVAWLKKELGDTIAESDYQNNTSLPLAAYVHRILDDKISDDRFISTYFTLIKSLLS